MQHRKYLNQSMLEHVALQQRSGKTIASYAKHIGVSRYKMQYWVRKYKARQKTQKIESDSSLKFIDLASFGIKDQSLMQVARQNLQQQQKSRLCRMSDCHK